MESLFIIYIDINFMCDFYVLCRCCMINKKFYPYYINIHSSQYLYLEE